jgi:hypothetical protein
MRDGRGAQGRESEPAAAQIAGLAGTDERHKHRVRAVAAADTAGALQWHTFAVCDSGCVQRVAILGVWCRMESILACVPGEERGAPMTAAPVA